MSDSIFGYRIHVIIEHPEGAIRINKPFKEGSRTSTEIKLDVDQILKAVSEFEKRLGPAPYQMVKLDVS